MRLWRVVAYVLLVVASAMCWALLCVRFLWCVWWMWCLWGVSLDGLLWLGAGWRLFLDSVGGQLLDDVFNVGIGLSSWGVSEV